MRGKFLSLCTLVAAIAFVGSTAWAQSSGNFTYGTTGGQTGCVLQSNGTISGGVSTCSESVGAGTFSCTSDKECTNILGSNSGATCSPADVTCSSNNDCVMGSMCEAGTCTQVCQEPNSGISGCIGSLDAGIKTNSGNGNVFDIRPSAVIGLLTDVTISSKQAGSIVSSSALAGIDFSVKVTGENGQPTPAIAPSGGVTYDARYVQISTNLFEGLSATCTSAMNGCFITFAESTVSAHSFDWIVGYPTSNTGGNGGTVTGDTLSSGVYDVQVDWNASASFGVSGIAEALACVGPVNLTVQQNKIFQFNTVNSF